ncbi:MAG: TonB-dependent receptor [Exilibacterium sp.]
MPESPMDGIPFNKTLLAVCLSATIQPNTWAQDREEELSDQDIEEVVVYAQRASLQSAQQIKRESDTFVDAISATDINALPDVSVLETLQRVPGISIERFASPNDPDHFSSEGSGATLRGLPQTRSAFNGRDTFSANSSRGLSFQDVSPELMGSIKVFKNQTADMVEGGISGTIDLNTRKPFDADEQILRFSIQENYGDIAEKVTPSLSAVFSDRYDVSIGELGLLLSYAESDMNFRSDGVEFGRHTLVPDAAGPGEDRFAPINGGIRSTTTQRDRQGIAASLQFRNTDDTIGALFEYISSDSSTDWLEHAFFSDDGAGQIDENSQFNSTEFISGTVNNVASGLGPQTRRSQLSTLVEDFSLRLEFNPTEKLSISTDFQYVDASTDRLDLSVFGGITPQADAGINIGLNSQGRVPDVIFEAPTDSPQSADAFYTDPANYYWRAAMDHVEESDGEEKAFQLDADYELDSTWARSLEAGVRYAERDQTTRWSTFNWGNLSESWNGGYATFDGTVNSNGAGSDAFEAFSFDDFYGGNAGGIAGAASGIALFPDAGIVSNPNAFLQAIASFGRPNLRDRPGVIPGSIYLPAEINRTNEENRAAYLKLNFFMDGNRRLQGNVGVRYVEVDTRVGGGVSFPTLSPNAAQFATEEELAFASGFSSEEDSESSYSELLPSFNLKYELAENLITRFAFSKAIAFPDLGVLRYNYNIGAQTVEDAEGNPRVTGWQQNSGNPFLEPMRAENYDLSAEWYFGASNFLSAGVFYKDIENFFANDTRQTEVTNPSTGATQIVDINQPINLGQASLTGFELAYQQFFDQLPGFWNGLGMQFNFTYLHDDGVPQQNLRSVEANDRSGERTALPFDELPLQGLSETSYNLVGLFHYGNFESRLAYNWRDDYLLTIRQVNLGLPVFAEARGQLDGAAYYSFNDYWQVGVQGTNLLKQDTVTNMQVDASGTKVFRSSFVYDRRYSIILRARF